MASGALPPALPMVRIDSDYFWDGGLVSNTPLQHLLDNCQSKNMLVFQVDLFSATGELPRDMPEVMSRAKDIQYSSRTRTITDHFTQTHRLQQALFEALCAVPEDPPHGGPTPAKNRSCNASADQYPATDLSPESL